MITKFFLYNKSDGIMWCILPVEPDNANYTDTRGNVWYDNSKRVGGVNWDNVDYYSNETGKAIDDLTDFKWIYDDGEETISLNQDYVEDEI